MLEGDELADLVPDEVPGEGDARVVALFVADQDHALAVFGCGGGQATKCAAWAIWPQPSTPMLKAGFSVVTVALPGFSWFR